MLTNTEMKSQETFTHTPVMAEEIFTLLKPALGENLGENPGKNKVLYDLTLGLGGHTEYFLDRIHGLKVIGIDRDTTAIDLATERLSRYSESNQFETFHGTYDKIADAISATNRRPNAVLMDLGVSSMQLDADDRGFAYSRDVKLDMRMDQTSGQSAEELIHTWGVDELTSIIKEYGEERYAKGIATAIKDANPKTTGELADAIRKGLPNGAKTREKTNAISSIKRVFQAIRIATNQELEILKSAIENVIDETEIDGRIAVMSYHSLEDRMIKRVFSEGANPEIDEITKSLPYSPSNQPTPYLELLTKGALTPTDSELETNPRSKPVRVRAVCKIAERKVSDRKVPAGKIASRENEPRKIPADKISSPREFKGGSHG